MFLFWIWIFYLLLFSQNSNFCIRKFVLKNFAVYHIKNIEKEFKEIEEK